MLDISTEKQIKINEDDIEIKTSRGSGPGGQHRNKVESCVTATHHPTGISVRIDSRSQYQSKELALRILTAKLNEENQNKQHIASNQIRRKQIGTGMRGDKVRSYRAQDDRVIDNRTGQTWSLKKWMKGEW